MPARAGDFREKGLDSGRWHFLRIVFMLPQPTSKVTVRLWPGARTKLYEELSHYRGDQPPLSQFISRLIQDCPQEFWQRVRGSMGIAEPLKRRRPSTKITVRLWPKALEKFNKEMQQLYWGQDKSPVSEFVSRLIQEYPDAGWKKVRESMDVKYDEWE